MMRLRDVTAHMTYGVINMCVKLDGCMKIITEPNKSINAATISPGHPYCELCVFLFILLQLLYCLDRKSVV